MSKADMKPGSSQNAKESAWSTQPETPSSRREVGPHDAGLDQESGEDRSVGIMNYLIVQPRIEMTGEGSPHPWTAALFRALHASAISGRWLGSRCAHHSPTFRTRSISAWSSLADSALSFGSAASRIVSRRYAPCTSTSSCVTSLVWWSTSDGCCPETISSKTMPNLWTSDLLLLSPFRTNSGSMYSGVLTTRFVVFGPMPWSTNLANPKSDNFTE